VRALAGLTALAAAGALALGGCGGGGGDTSTTTPTEATVSQAPQAQAPKPQAAKPKPAADDESAAKTTSPHNAPGDPGNPTPGAKAPAPGVPVTPEGDNSVQTFGTEGEESQRSQAEADLRTYLTARAQGDWAGACKAASAQFAEELAKLIENAKAKPGTEKPQGCAQTLELLYGKAPGSSLQGAAQLGEVLSFRIREDGYAYLIFEDPEGEVKFIAMANDGGTWKVNTPEPASFQQSQGEAQ
jgi:hypothetical protein